MSAHKSMEISRFKLFSFLSIKDRPLQNQPYRLLKLILDTTNMLNERFFLSCLCKKLSFCMF